MISVQTFEKLQHDRKLYGEQKRKLQFMLEI